MLRKSIGSFDIAAHLDSGGMADVFLAIHPGSQTLAVVKILREHLRNEPDLLNMFHDETRIMTQLNHPNIVQVFEHGQVEGLPFLTMEYLRGDHLDILRRAAKRRKEPLSPTLVARIALQCSNGLAYVHDAVDDQRRPLSLVHRDISPQNIFVTYTGQVKILDFGIALSSQRESATKTGLLKGKLRYMSPEQIQARDTDRRSDLFSLGIVLWELLTFGKLFKAESAFQTMKLICDEPIPRPGEYSEVPEDLEVIVMRCLERERKQRYASAVDLRADLTEFLLKTSGHPKEIPDTVSRLLSQRKERKQAIVDSIWHHEDMQEFLFGDMELSDGTASGSHRAKIVPVPRQGNTEALPAEEPPAPPQAIIHYQPQDPESKAVAVPLAKPSRSPLAKLIRNYILPLLILFGLFLVFQLRDPSTHGTETETIDVTLPETGASMHPEPKTKAPPVPKPDAPKPADEQAADEQAADEQAADEQAADEQAADEQAADEQAADEQAADEQAADEQAADEQAADEQAADEQAADEQAADEQAADEQAADEQAADEQAADEQAADEQAADEQAADEEPLPADHFTNPDPKKAGFLRLVTHPACQIYVNDIFVGPSPIHDMALKPGHYKVLMLNQDNKIRESFELNIETGAVASRQFIF